MLFMIYTLTMIMIGYALGFVHGDDCRRRKDERIRHKRR